MNTINIQPISGFPEGLPEMQLLERRLLTKIETTFERFGFTPLDTPAVERMDVLTAKGGIEKQIYSVRQSTADEAAVDSDKADLALRFDHTVPLARYVAAHEHELTFPFRRYAIGPVWRGERAQRGRYRQFKQCDVDVVGRQSLDPMHDAEMPPLICATLDALGLPDFEVHISDRRLLGDVLRHHGIDDSAASAVYKAVDDLPRCGLDATMEKLTLPSLREALPTLRSMLESRTLEELYRVFLARQIQSPGLDALREVMDSAVLLGMPKDRLVVDVSVVRGLDYYTGPIFETFVRGCENWGSICSGGRYDDLARLFSQKRFPGVGVSIGITRLLALLVDKGFVETGPKTAAQVLVTMQDRSKHLESYLALARTLRDEGLATEVYLDPHPLRDQISYAANKGIRVAVIAGNIEFDYDRVVVRDLKHRVEEKVAGDDMVRHIRELLLA